MPGLRVRSSSRSRIQAAGAGCAAGHKPATSKAIVLLAYPRYSSGGTLGRAAPKGTSTTVQRDIRMKSDAPLSRAPLAVVNDAIAVIDAQAAVVTSDRHRDDDLALRGL
jgi:hypothetical protein